MVKLRTDKPVRSGLPAAVVLLASGLIAGCAPNENGGPAPEGPPGTPLRIAETPSLSLGVLDDAPAEEFHQLVTPFLLSDGRLVVPVSGFTEIRVFSPDGEFLEALGNVGEGPGELRTLTSAWPRGDTIELYDSRLQRVTRFLPEGSVEVVGLETATNAQIVIPGTLGDGWAATGIDASGLNHRDRMPLHRFARDGSHLGPVVTVEGMARHTTPGLTGPDPLSPRAVLAVGEGKLFAGEALSPRLQVFDEEGAPVREISWEADRGPSPEAAFRTVVDEAVARAGPDQVDAVRERMEAFPVRNRLPAFWGVLADAEGFLWLRPYDPLKHAFGLGGSPLGGPGPGGEWRIFTPEGEEVGSVRMPEGLEPHQVTSEAVVGIRRDELGVESVHVHAVERR